MSSYLLLRNNKESGPYTLDEVKGISLKKYDLVWIVGKSAAWRYPEEISELKPFLPSASEEQTDLPHKRIITETPATDSSGFNITNSIGSERSADNSHRPLSDRTIYINLPAEKKSVTQFSELSSEYSNTKRSENLAPDNTFSEVYTRQSSRVVSYSGKLLWFGTIILLFGAGIMTGFFISDRRIFFTS